LLFFQSSLPLSLPSLFTLTLLSFHFHFAFALP
jgi:hypothetical protein